MKKSFYLGIDVGGTEIRGILLDRFKNRWFLVFDTPTPKNKKLFLKTLNKEIGKLTPKKKIIGIGTGLPGSIDVKRGLLVKAPNLPFLNGWPAKKFLSKFKTKIKIDNDSRCFLRAEAVLGVGKKYKNIVALTIGTGIGGGLMINGKIYYGAHNAAGEFGHMILADKKSLEQLGAKKAFLKTGDTGKIIGLGVADLINVLDPAIVILGGGGIVKAGVKIETVRKIARKYVMSPLAKKTPIVKGKLGEYSQAIGAALLMKIK
jgi:predicted NBD/HSP70 family sugar kinase